MKREAALCPSGRCEAGSVLLGVVQEDGRVAFLPPGFVVDEEFVRIARAGRNPHGRFRFSTRCVESACRQWRGDRCTVLDDLREPLAPYADASRLPDCAIRAQCRWHRQDGPAACALCPLVITEMAVAEEEPAEPSLAALIES
jgi:hypothetical protein